MGDVFECVGNSPSTFRFNQPKFFLYAFHYTRKNWVKLDEMLLDEKETPLEFLDSTKLHSEEPSPKPDGENTPFSSPPGVNGSSTSKWQVYSTFEPMLTGRSMVTFTFGRHVQSTDNVISYPTLLCSKKVWAGWKDAPLSNHANNSSARTMVLYEKLSS
ncbi:hypothetical protein F5878DRAFT_647771 [Lentinula raphanica]|uniref:Uncharacterized protein n=1 Tax=Lentinula raphanica TaxID=153919 RepID=A0AA38NVG2_9AGAR|nr:hypothetical protein F5878DRAFT_647771 [Lentinula raphanica]